MPALALEYDSLSSNLAANLSSKFLFQNLELIKLNALNYCTRVIRQTGCL